MADKGKLERSFFTTRNITDGREKVHAWRDSAGFIFDVNPHDSIELPGFFADIESYHYGSLVTSICTSRSSHFVRTPLDAARNGVDHFLVQIYLEGECHFAGDATNSLLCFLPGRVAHQFAPEHILRDNRYIFGFRS